MDKIVINLIGGVGNQLFQYACAYAVSKASGIDLFVDLSSYDEYKVRNFELDKFNIQLKVANPDEFQDLNKKHFFRKTLYKDKKKTFNPEILKIRHSAYLKGFWQSEKYFAHIRSEILELFSFKSFDFLANKDILNKIKNTNSVCINLRLGDYVNNDTFRKIYFLCDKSYYSDAISSISKMIDNPTFFVFSDDIIASKEYLPQGYEYNFADTANWQEDMYFMSQAKHNIVANSSFSWWSAWLNRNPNKIVLAPSSWYRKGAKINDKDVIPQDWIKIKTSN